MIFVTVGTQLAFDRMIAAVDTWASRNRGIEVVAQVGPSQYQSQNFKARDFIPPSEANRLFAEAELIVSHAGMGSILTAMKFRKPILIMPRKAACGEHRNDHQMATAKWLGGRAGVIVAWDEFELPKLLDERHNLCGGGGISDSAQPQLIAAVQRFIAG